MMCYQVLIFGEIRFSQNIIKISSVSSRIFSSCTLCIICIIWVAWIMTMTMSRDVKLSVNPMLAENSPHFMFCFEHTYIDLSWPDPPAPT